MRKIKLYIAASLDGYIARPDDGLDWLIDFPNPTNTDYAYQEFYDTIDTIIMGGKTYRTILNMSDNWVYEDRQCYVVSRDKAIVQTAKTKLLTDTVIVSIVELRATPGKDIWLMGGGELVALFLKHDLIDTMIITYMPVTIGDGIRLFPDGIKETTWRIGNTAIYENGVVQLEYIRL